GSRGREGTGDARRGDRRSRAPSTGCKPTRDRHPRRYETRFPSHNLPDGPRAWFSTTRPLQRGVPMDASRAAATHGYLIDMDGVLYRGTDPIPGADTFLNGLRDRGIPFRLLTNNSQRTRRDVAAKLVRMGLDVEEAHVFTSAMATARFLAQQKPHGTAFVIGEGGLLTALHENGYAVVDHDPDYVVVGEGRTFNLELVEAAVRMIVGGAKLIATNL